MTWRDDLQTRLDAMSSEDPCDYVENLTTCGETPTVASTTGGFERRRWRLCEHHAQPASHPEGYRVLRDGETHPALEDA